VTVDRTKTPRWQITVKWRSAFDIVKSLYRYRVLRAESFTGVHNIMSLHANTIIDSVFTDPDVNSDELAYNYRIVLYNSAGKAVDTSAWLLP